MCDRAVDIPLNIQNPCSNFALLSADAEVKFSPQQGFMEC